MKHFRGKRGHHTFHGFKRGHEEFHGHKNGHGEFHGFKRGHHKFTFHAHGRHGYSQEEVARVMQFFDEAAGNRQSNVLDTNNDGTKLGVPEAGIADEPLPNGNSDELAEYWPLKFKKIRKFAKYERKWKCKNKHGKFERIINRLYMAANGEKAVDVSDGADKEEFQEDEMQRDFSGFENDGMESGNHSEPGQSKVKKIKFDKHKKKWKYYGKEELKQLIEILRRVTEKGKVTDVDMSDGTHCKTNSNSNESEMERETQLVQMEDGEVGQPTELLAEDEAGQPTEPVAEDETDQPTDSSTEILPQLPKLSCWLSKCKKLKKFHKHEKKWTYEEMKRLGKWSNKFKVDKMNKDIELLFKKGK